MVDARSVNVKKTNNNNNKKNTVNETQKKLEMPFFHTRSGGVFSYLPHHLDLALEDSVGHSTCMSVLARRRAIMGWLVG